MGPYECTDEEIIRAIRYIKDDRYIASIFGVNVKRIKSLREKESMANKDRKQPVQRGIFTHVKSKDGATEHEKAMEKGSSMLRDAVIEFLMNRRAKQENNRATS